MGVVDDLMRARAEFERSDWTAALERWSGVRPDGLGVDDLHDAATAAYLLGRRHSAVDFEQRALAERQLCGDTAGGVRCCFYLAMFCSSGEQSRAHGWTVRADRLLVDLGEDTVEHGFVAILHLQRHLRSGDLSAAVAAAAVAEGVARQHGNADLLALALCSRGRLSILAGRVVEGVGLLDEAMASVGAGEICPVIVGDTYCTAVEGCQEIADFRRVAEWTSAMHRWCSGQPGLVAYTGQCSLHRGQVLRARGAWAAALEEFDRAIERYRQESWWVAIGAAEVERADVFRLRGELDAAQTTYQRAAEAGCEPQPGLALLWSANGNDSAAVAAVRRLVAEASDPVTQCRVLPAAVDVLVAAGHIDEARSTAGRLDQLAAAVATEPLRALSAYASGVVALASGDAVGALATLRAARRLWANVESPYEGARVLLQTGRALLLLDDLESGRIALEAAGATFRRLGARPFIEEVASLLRPAVRPAGLTDREIEVLRLVASGCSNAEVADELVLSEKTVARHLSNIFTKLGVGSRTAAAAYAFQHQLV